MPPDYIHIAIVEDDTEVRNALSSLVNKTGDLILTGAYNSAEEFILNIDNQNDVILMDIHLPGKNGIEAVKKIKEKSPKTQCMMFTVFEDEDKIFDALCAGATGYLLKNTSSEKIIEAIREIYGGGSPMSANIARKVVQSFKPAKKPGIEILTDRETEILDYLSKGYRYKEISAFLFISTETVRTHIRNIYAKLEVQSRTDALNKVFKSR